MPPPNFDPPLRVDPPLEKYTKGALHQELEAFRATLLEDITVLIQRQELSLKAVFADGVVQAPYNNDEAKSPIKNNDEKVLIPSMWRNTFEAPGPPINAQVVATDSQPGRISTASYSSALDPTQSSAINAHSSMVAHRGTEEMSGRVTLTLDLSPMRGAEVNKHRTTLQQVERKKNHTRVSLESESWNDKSSMQTLKDAAGVSDRMVLFGNSAILQDQTDLDQDVYNVNDLYNKTGCAQLVARSHAFNNLTLAVICGNAIYMGIDADHNRADNLSDADLVFQVCENMFCAFFTIEIAFRFFALEVKRNCFKDSWFKFDFALVTLMILETWLFPLLVSLIGISTDNLRSGPVRLLRLLRLARVTRIMRCLPELVTMAKGMFAAVRAVFSALVMLILLTYVFAIVMFSFLKDVVALGSRWSTISECIWTLLLNGVLLDDVSTVAKELRDEREDLSLVILLMFILVSAITIMNMLIGVLCEVVAQVAIAEKENAARAELRHTILQMLRNLDDDGSGEISQDELMGLLEDPFAVSVFQDLQVDITHFLEFQAMFYDSQDGDLTIGQIMSSVLELRGDRPTTVQDMVNAQTFTRWCLNEQMQKQTKNFQNLVDVLIPMVGQQAKSGVR